MNIRVVAGSITLFCVMPTFALTAPNPPPPPVSVAVSAKLISTFDAHDPIAYESLFAPTVHVFQDGALVASSRAEWMGIVEKQFRGPLKVQRILSAPGVSQILVAETLSNYGWSRGGQLRDCCVWARIGRYVLDNDYKIVDVRFFSDTAAYWQPVYTSSMAQ